MRDPFSREIPLHEAADFFIRVRHFEKSANMPQLPAAAMGVTKPMPTPSVLPNAAMGQHVKAAQAFKLALEQALPTLPPEYISAEQEGMAAQGQNEAAFYRERLQQASEELAQAQAQLQDSQAQAQQLEASVQQASEQQSQYQQMVQSATQNAMSAQDEVLRQQQAAAAMRMAYQQLRGQLLQAATQEPPTTDVLMQQTAPVGAANAPTPQAGPTAVGPGGEAAPQENAQSGSNQGTEQATQKVSSVLTDRVIPAVAGAGLGAAVEGTLARSDNSKMKDKLQQLEAKGGPEKGFVHAMNLARAKAMLALSEATHAHPNAATAAGALVGATAGAMAGPDIANHVRSSMGSIQKMRALG